MFNESSGDQGALDGTIMNITKNEVPMSNITSTLDKSDEALIGATNAINGKIYYMLYIEIYMYICVYIIRYSGVSACNSSHDACMQYYMCGPLFKPFFSYNTKLF